MDFRLPDPLVQLRREAEELALDAALRADFPEDSWLVGFDPTFTKELGRRGWIGMTWPTRVGGHGRSALERFVVYEQLIRHGAPIAAGWFADRQIGPALLQYGSSEQQRRWLPDMIAGCSNWCIGMSEPDAGSDVAAVRTSGRRDGRDWIVTGQKVWTSGAVYADWCYCVVRTDELSTRHGGLSELVIDMRSDGIEVSPIRDMTGNRHFNEVRFNEVRVSGENLIGIENASFGQIMRQMELERGGIDRLVSNYALFRDVCASRALIDHRDVRVRQELAVIETSYRLGRQLVLREVLAQAPPGYSALAKAFCTEFEVRVANFCASQIGAPSLLWGLEAGIGGRAARAVCYAPAYTIMGGTTEILRNIVAERVLGLPR
jgi:alkylation response protein AidB-like acyl-CoA dehydrogenase